jgi:hypothetical protein
MNTFLTKLLRIRVLKPIKILYSTGITDLHNIYLCQFQDNACSYNLIILLKTNI